MTLSELITASRVNGWNVVDEILYQTYLDTLAGSGGISEQILSALQTYDGSVNYFFSNIFDLSDAITPIYAIPLEVLFLGGTFYNPNNVPVFVKFYDSAIPTLSTPNYILMIPALGQVVLDSTTTYFSTVSLYAACHTTYNGTIAPVTSLKVSNIKYKVIPTV